MVRGTKFLAFAIVIIIAFILQVALIIADKHESPAKSAVEFAKAYFKLDQDMAQYLCNELTEAAQEDVVDAYLNRVAEKAGAMGYKTSYMKTALSHIESETEMQDENTAVVRIKAERRRYLNPVFGAIAKIFFLTETYPVDISLALVQENGQWKVCGAPFSRVEL